jgi:hypothetical protein
MSGILRLGNGVMAVLTSLAAIVALIFLPDAWAQRDTEPEDLLVLCILVVLMAGFAATALLSRSGLKAESGGGRRAKWLAGVNLATGLLCVVGVLLGHTSGQPSSVDMYVLTLPALLFGLNGYAFLFGRWRGSASSVLPSRRSERAAR